MTPDGMTIVESRHGPDETVDRLAAAIAAREMTVMARVDHAAAAAKAGLDLRSTLVLMFGNPVAGTPLMQAVQTIGIDLPLKMLVWLDAEGKTVWAHYLRVWTAWNHVRTVAPLAALACFILAFAKQWG